MEGPDGEDLAALLVDTSGSPNYRMYVAAGSTLDAFSLNPALAACRRAGCARSHTPSATASYFASRSTTRNRYRT